MPNRLKVRSLSAASSLFLLFSPAVGWTQQSSATNSGACTVLVQGSNNNITIADLCSPTKNIQFAGLSQSGTKPTDSPGAAALQFTIRELVFDARAQTMYLGMVVGNRGTEPALLQLISAASSIQLSDPPASIHVQTVEGLGACRAAFAGDAGGGGAARYCLGKANDIDSTSIEGGGTVGFRLIGHNFGNLVNISPDTSASVSLAFMRQIGNKYQKLDLSFLDVKLRESR